VKLGILTLIAMYLTIWWTVIFAILPLGLRSHAEEGVKAPPGCEPGAPVKIDFKRKAITTTWVSIIVFVVLVVIIESGWVTLPQLSSQ
jgi:predicted secreted protein